MKRRDFINYLEKHHCYFYREGSSHSIFRNIKNNQFPTVPRHPEIDDFLCKKICRDLGIYRIAH
jgi:predicted RNA binding protein YcfA (HicA-like mRNA interferase family)